MSEIFDVVVIGCGPTGLTSALWLANAGHRVAVVDRHKKVYSLPRAIAYDHEVARILNHLGLSDAMRPYVATPGTYEWRNKEGQLLFELDWAKNKSISGFQHSYLFSQPDLELVLNNAAVNNKNITLLRGVEVTSMKQCSQGVDICGKDELDSDVIIRGKWLIGADGARSSVRQHIASELEDLGFQADWLVVDVVPKLQGSLPLNDDLMLQVCDPVRPTTVVSGGPGRRRWEFMARESETLEQLNSEKKAWSLLKTWGVTPENARLERHAVYTFRGALANVLRKGRIFIAGDAAHLTPPFAGQGLCAGFRDAAAIAWRLDLALRGLANEELLDSYESERRHHARKWVMNAIELGKVICVLQPEDAKQRDANMVAAREAGLPPPSDSILPRLGIGTHLGKHSGGTLAVGGTVELDGVRGHFDDVVGKGFILLTRRKSIDKEIGQKNQKLLASLKGKIINLALDFDGIDVEGTYHAWLDELKADTAFIRPDFYLVGALTGENAGNILIEALNLHPLHPNEQSRLTEACT